MSTHGRGTSASTADPGPLGVILLVATVAGAIFFWRTVVAPAGGMALQLYAGLVAIPSHLGAVSGASLGLSVLFGALAGLVIGLLRARRRGPVAELAADVVIAPEMMGSLRLSLAVAFYHVLIGAAAGALVGLLGMASPFELLGGRPGPLLDAVLPAAALLTGAGLFNGGGAPPAVFELSLLFLVILLFAVLVTILVSMVTTAAIAFLANLLLGSAARAAGSSLGAVLAQYADPRARERESGWLGAALRTGFVAGFVNGTATTSIVLAVVFLAGGRVVAAAEPAPRVAPLVRIAAPGADFLRGSLDRQVLYAVGDTVYEWRFPHGPAVAWDPNAEGASDRAHRLWREQGIPAGPLSTFGSNLPEERTLGGRGVLRAEGTRARIVDPETGTVLRELEPPGEAEPSYQRDLTDRLVAAWVGEPVERVVVWDAASGRILHRLPAASAYPQLALSPDSRRLMVLEGHRLTVWDLETGGHRRLSGHRGELFSGQWSTDGRRLVTTSRREMGGELRVWDGVTGRALWQLDLGSVDAPVVGPGYVAVLDGGAVAVYALR